MKLLSSKKEEMPYKLSIKLLIIFSLFGMVFFSSYGINRSIWLDEAWGPLFVTGNTDFLIDKLKMDSHPPLYYFLLSIWIKAFGQSEAALRSLSGVFYFLSVFSVYFIVRKLYDQRAGLICAFLFLLSPLIILHSQNARPYMLLTLFSVGSTGYFFKTFIQQKCSVKNLAIYIVFNIFGTFTHYCFAFVLISHFICLSCHYYSWKFFKAFVIAEALSLIPFIVLWSPILRIQLGLNTSAWVPEPKLIHLFNVFLKFYHPAFYLFFCFLSIYNFWNRYHSGNRGGLLKESDIKSNIRAYLKEDIAWLYLFFGSFLSLFLVSFIKPIFLPRYAIISLFPLVLILFHLIRNIRFSYKHVICAYLLIAVSLFGFVRKINTAQWWEKPNRATIQYLINHSEPQDIIIFTHLSRAALEFYLGYYNVKKNYTLISFPDEVSNHLGWINEEAMMKKESELEDEAKSLAIDLKNRLGKNNKVWLFFHSQYKTPKIIKKELDLTFSESEITKITGTPFYDEIITFK